MCKNADGSVTNVGSSAASASATASSPATSSQPNQGSSVGIAYGLTFMAAVGISLLLA